MAGCPKDISRRSILSVKSPLIPNFWTPFPFYSRHYNPFPLTGTGMENCIPEFWEREREWKIAFPTFGNGNGNEKLIPKLWEREWEACIPGNGREWELPLTPGRTPLNLWICKKSKYIWFCLNKGWGSKAVWRIENWSVLEWRGIPKADQIIQHSVYFWTSFTKITGWKEPFAIFQTSHFTEKPANGIYWIYDTFSI